MKQKDMDMTDQKKAPERLAGGHGPAAVWVTSGPVSGYAVDRYLYGVNDKPWDADYDAPITTYASNEKYIRADLAAEQVREAREAILIALADIPHPESTDAAEALERAYRAAEVAADMSAGGA